MVPSEPVNYKQRADEEHSILQVGRKFQTRLPNSNPNDDEEGEKDTKKQKYPCFL
jgi:hypothetical protein